MQTCTNTKETLDLVYGIFCELIGKDVIDSKEEFKPIAQKIWRIWQENHTTIIQNTNQTLYLSELHYFFDTKYFPFEKAFLATAKAVAKYCTYYRAQLIVPEGVEDTVRKGTLPDSQAEKEQCIDDLYVWIKTHSAVTNLFSFFLDIKPIEQDFQEERPTVKFNHHDDTCCWLLNLSDNEFTSVQTA